MQRLVVAIAELHDAAQRNDIVGAAIDIYMRYAGLDAALHSEGSAEVCRPDGEGEAVIGSIGNLKGLTLATESDNQGRQCRYRHSPIGG